MKVYVITREGAVIGAVFTVEALESALGAIRAAGGLRYGWEAVPVLGAGAAPLEADAVHAARSAEER